MEVKFGLQRFIDAQLTDFNIALKEIKNGRKESHWMWYIFPQISGLGVSSTAQFYSLKDLEEAQQFFLHPVLGSRLIIISKELLLLKSNDAYAIFGSPDDKKLRSSMTLFASLNDTDPVFSLVLDKYFKGMKDQKTLDLINKC